MMEKQHKRIFAFAAVGQWMLVCLVICMVAACQREPQNTKVDGSGKGEALSDEQLLDTVQRQTFRYFWDYAHPVSGLIRERAKIGHSGTDEVTIGGSGFGVMALLVGIERGYIARAQGLKRMQTMTRFLKEKTPRFHGAWSHWVNGTTGEVIPFSPDDNGGDLVETAFMFQGLLSARQYFDAAIPGENGLRATIDSLWNEMEWDWYTQGGQPALYWHWSPDKGWKMNHRIQGWNEALIVYVLAASSTTHPVDTSAYHQGWAKEGAIRNGKSFYDIVLPLGPDFGGPLFFAHYSFLGLDPTHLQDRYADYWKQNVAHARINHAYCLDNPKGWKAYDQGSWGLTASYSINFYNAHSPTNDTGVISPTASLASMPYTPQESMQALRWMYETQQQKLWNLYGFIDAYSFSAPWFSDGYLAIDQGPIILMIENYRSGLLWRLFMSCPEVQNGLDRLGFTY